MNFTFGGGGAFQTGGNPAAGTGRRRVLVVEGDADLRDVLAKIVRANGMDVTAVATAAEGLRALEQRPALVILDLKLPDGPGIPVLEHIRARRLPIKVAVSAPAADAGLLSDARRLRPDRVLKKPFGLLEFAGWMYAAAA